MIFCLCYYVVSHTVYKSNDTTFLISNDMQLYGVANQHFNILVALLFYYVYRRLFEKVVFLQKTFAHLNTKHRADLKLFIFSSQTTYHHFLAYIHRNLR